MIECNQLRDRAKDRELTERQTTKIKGREGKQKLKNQHYMVNTHSCLISSSATQQGQDTSTKKFFKKVLTSTQKCVKIKSVQEKSLNTRERVKGERNEYFKRSERNSNG